MTIEEIEARLACHHLAVFGGFYPDPDDATPVGCQTLLLLGPREPGFWDHVTAKPEFSDGKPDPLDRWSRRVIGRLACDLRRQGPFPFGGPPFQPFIGWAQRTGRAHVSPVTLLVHDMAGLMASWRRALALRDRIDLPPPPPPPASLARAPARQPALLARWAGRGMTLQPAMPFSTPRRGRIVWIGGAVFGRACPVSETYGRRPEQSAFHMRSFHP